MAISSDESCQTEPPDWSAHFLVPCCDRPRNKRRKKERETQRFENFFSLRLFQRKKTTTFQIDRKAGFDGVREGLRPAGRGGPE